MGLWVSVVVRLRWDVNPRSRCAGLWILVVARLRWVRRRPDVDAPRHANPDADALVRAQRRSPRHVIPDADAPRHADRSLRRVPLDDAVPHHVEH